MSAILVFYFRFRSRQFRRKCRENRRLCSTFAHYFVDKIVILRDSVNNTLCALSVSVPSDLSFPSHRGSVLDILSPVTSDEVGRVLASSPAKSSTMDIIPTSLVLRCKAVFVCEIIAHLANLSFSEGRFPTLFKQATVIPLIKGTVAVLESYAVQYSTVRVQCGE